MATGQSLLDRMELLAPELQLQSGESDVTRGLTALNTAQDYLESVLALHPGVLGDTSGTVTTAKDTETTTFPTGLLRIDGLQYIDPSTSRPAWDLVTIRRTGGHAWQSYWPYNLISTSTTGKPRAFWTNGRNIYWDPLPDAVHTVRWYGIQAASDITAGGTFAFPDAAMLPLASLAVRVIKLGWDDATDELMQFANDLFTPLVELLRSFNRTGAPGFEYAYTHDT